MLENFGRKAILNETVWGILKRHSYNVRVARRKPLVSVINRKTMNKFYEKIHIETCRPLV